MPFRLDAEVATALAAAAEAGGLVPVTPRGDTIFTGNNKMRIFQGTLTQVRFVPRLVPPSQQTGTEAVSSVVTLAMDDIKREAIRAGGRTAL